VHGSIFEMLAPPPPPSHALFDEQIDEKNLFTYLKAARVY